MHKQWNIVLFALTKCGNGILYYVNAKIYLSDAKYGIWNLLWREKNNVIANTTYLCIII